MKFYLFGMYSLWVVVVFLLTLLRNISITISYIRNTEPDNKVMVDGRFRDSIAKYRNNIGNYASIDNDRKSTGHEESDIKKYKEKSSVQDMFMLKEPIRFKVSYPPAEYRFFKSMLNKDLCDQYTLECIYVNFSFEHTNSYRIC